MSTTPAAHPAQYRELTGLDPDALRRRPTPYEQIMRALPQIAVERLPGDAGGLEIRAPAGTVEISGEAMAQGLATTLAVASGPSAADAVTNETEDSEHDDTLTNSSPSGDMHPDLGERVL